MDTNPSTALYKKIKKNHPIYEEAKHCQLILDVMADPNLGTVSAFCVRAGISDRTFWKWTAQHEIFDECYRTGKMLAREAWEAEGRQNKGNPDWNYEYWRMIGWSRFGVGKNSRVRVDVDHMSNPMTHYSQLLKQASNGDFTAGELKQLSEVVNVGLRAQEVITMQEQIDELKDDFNTMNKNSNG